MLALDIVDIQAVEVFQWIHHVQLLTLLQHDANESARNDSLDTEAQLLVVVVEELLRGSGWVEVLIATDLQGLSIEDVSSCKGKKPFIWGILIDVVEDHDEAEHILLCELFFLYVDLEDVDDVAVLEVRRFVAWIGHIDFLLQRCLAFEGLIYLDDHLRDEEEMIVNDWSSCDLLHLEFFFVSNQVECFWIDRVKSGSALKLPAEEMSVVDPEIVVCLV